MAYNELSGQSNVNNVPSNSSSNLPKPITRDIAVQKDTSVPTTQDFQQTHQEALDNGLVPAILQQYGDETLYVENFKLDHGWRHSIQGYARSKIEEAFAPYITLHLGGSDIKKEIKDIENNPNDTMHAHQIAYNIIKEYDSGKISKETALKYSKELIAAVPDVGEGLFNYDMSGAVDENGVPLMSYHMDNRLEELGFKEKGSSLEEQTKQWVRNNSISDGFATNILLTEPDEKTKAKQELRDSSAFILKFAGRNLKSAAKMGTSLAYMYGMKLINAGMGAQFQRGGFAASDEAMSGVKSIASTGWGYTRAMGGAVLSTMSMQIKAYAKLAKSAISEKWAEGLEERYDKKRGKLLKITDEDKRNKKLKQNDEKFRAKANKRTSSSDAHAGTDKEHPVRAIFGNGLKQLGVNAGAGLAKGAIKSPKKMVSFSTRQLSKMTTEAFGQTNSTLSSMWSTSKKTLRYSKKTIKAVAKAPKRIKQSIETMRKLGQAIAKVAQAIARAAVQVVTQAVSFLMSNPIILGIIGAIVAAILLGQMLGSCTYVCSELGSGVLGALFVTPYNIGYDVWQDYEDYQDLWYITFTRATSIWEDKYKYNSEGSIEEYQVKSLITGNPYNKFNEEGISLYEDYFGQPCPYADDQIAAFDTVISFDGRWTNPYALVCYMTTVYGDFTTEYMENGLDNVIGSIDDKEHSLFFTQYDISLEFKESGKITDEEGTSYTISDYNDCTADDFINVAERHEKISPNGSGEDTTVIQYTLTSDVYVVEDKDGNVIDDDYYKGKIFDEVYDNGNGEIVQQSGRTREILSNALNNGNIISTTHIANGKITAMQTVEWENKNKYVKDAENDITTRWVFSGTTIDENGDLVPVTMEQDDKTYYFDINGMMYEHLYEIPSDQILYKTQAYYIYYCYHHTYTLTVDSVYADVTINNMGTFEAAIECLKVLDEEDAAKEGKELEVRDGYFTVHNYDTGEDITFDTSSSTADDYKKLTTGCVVTDYQNPYEDYPRVRQFQELCYNYGYCTYSNYGQNGEGEEPESDEVVEIQAWDDEENPNDISDYTPGNEADKELVSWGTNQADLVYIYSDGYAVDVGNISDTGYWFPLYWAESGKHNDNDANDPEFALYNNSGYSAENFGDNLVGGYVTYKMFLAGYYGLYNGGEIFDPGLPNVTHQNNYGNNDNGVSAWGEGTGTYNPDRSKGKYYDYYDFDDFDRLYDEVSGACWPEYYPWGEPILTESTYSTHNARDLGGGITDAYVCAAYSGVVYTTTYDPYHSNTGSSYGISVVILHNADGYEDLALDTIGYDGWLLTRYAHLDHATVSEGQRVNKGDVIGISDNTGHTTGPHLHFELNWTGKNQINVGWHHPDSMRIFPGIKPPSSLSYGGYWEPLLNTIYIDSNGVWHHATDITLVLN